MPTRMFLVERKPGRNTCESMENMRNYTQIEPELRVEPGSLCHRAVLIVNVFCLPWVHGGAMVAIVRVPPTLQKHADR